MTEIIEGDRYLYQGFIVTITVYSIDMGMVFFKYPEDSIHKGLHNMLRTGEFLELAERIPSFDEELEKL